MMSRRELVLVLSITVFGALLRLYQLGAQSLWLDELFSVAAASGNWAKVVAVTAMGDTNPPLYNLVLHLAMQLGSDEVTVRLPSSIFSIATIPLLYIFARDLFGIRAAGLSALGIAVSPFHVLFAQEARMYALLGFLTLTATLFFYRAWLGAGFWNWALFVLSAILALYTHSLAFLYLVALGVFALVAKNQWRERWRQWVVAHIVILIAFLPWVGVELQQVGRVQSGFWAAPPSPLAFLTVPFLLLNGDTMPSQLLAVALFALLALFALALVAAARTIMANRHQATGLYLALSLLLVPLTGLYAISLFRPIFVERTLLPSSFGLVLLLAWVMTSGRQRIATFALGIIVLVGMAISLANYSANAAVQKPPFREAANAVSAQMRSNDIIVHTSDSSALAFNYYLPSATNHFLAGDPDYVAQTTRGTSGRLAGLTPVEWDAIAEGHSRAWLVVALDHNIDYQRDRVREFDAAYGPATKQNVGGIGLYLYDIER